MQAIVGVDGEQRFLGLRVGILRFVQGGSSFVHVLTKCYDQLGGRYGRFGLDYVCCCSVLEAGGLQVGCFRVKILVIVFVFWDRWD